MGECQGMGAGRESTYVDSGLVCSAEKKKIMRPVNCTSSKGSRRLNRDEEKGCADTAIEFTI